MAEKPPRILYVTGWMRSGSTLLGNVLNELPGVLHVGELHYLWQNGVLESGTNSDCGCGLSLRDCPLWSAVLTATQSATPDATATAHHVTMRQHALLRTRHTRTRLAEARGETVPAPGITELLDRTADIYRLVAREGGDRLIVDGSKYPAEAAALLGRSDLDVRVLHVVRDPRATALSYRRSKQYIDPMSPARSSNYWTAFNLASELIGESAGGRYLRIRHEDLSQRPKDVVTEVLRFAGLDDASPVDESGKVHLSGNHTVTGNPDRLRQGETLIRPDSRWHTELSAADTATVTALTAPLLARYGYPVLPGRVWPSPEKDLG
ncbi:sulfotransferase [Streptomyces inhibens]|uniref:Sulfotransferase n=1 Tax=Streptomyces inhibens TaxID=2293571 RepID=A0A371Q542_STRIH|nr:sulfotransferase [Streptomyces inhibens]REK89820.1 sulfotransferase [Streptomyces inhibens]